MFTWLESSTMFPVTEFCKEYRFFESIYLNLAQVVGASENAVKIVEAKWFNLVWGFTVLVIVATYTASLVAMLTIEIKPLQEIDSMNDAVEMEIVPPADIAKYGDTLRKMHPSLKLWDYNTL